MPNIEKVCQDLKQMPLHLQNEVSEFIDYLRYRDSKKTAQQRADNTDTFFARLTMWREKNHALLDDESPWDNVRSKEVGHDFSWED